MEKYVLFLMSALVLLIVVPAWGQDEGSALQRETFFSATLNEDIAYGVYLPAGYNTMNLAYPVIYLLHGRGDSMAGWMEMRGTLDDLIASGAIPPLIAIMPNLPQNAAASYYVDSAYTGSDYPGAPIETAFFSDLIPYIDATYRTIVDREGRAVSGYSMGGYGAMRYLLAHPDVFKGAIVLSPAVYTPLPPLDSSTREFGAFGRDESLFDDTVYQSLNYPALLDTVANSKLPLYMFIAVGDDEWKHPNPEDQWHDLDLEAHFLYNAVSRVSNIASELRVYNGGHDWDMWEPAFIDGVQYIFRFMARPS